MEQGGISLGEVLNGCTPQTYGVFNADPQCTAEARPLWQRVEYLLISTEPELPKGCHAVS